ncbi:chloride channel protein, partial [Escherichia coli]|uniref:chloride channel protein n=1 Tax=Escherichia coli TaxID=562 RepID=UPI002023BB52
RGIVFPGKSFFSAHEVSTCKISGCLSYRILDSGPDGTQTTLTIFLCKLCAVLASSGSGAPGGVFTPTLFIGLAIGMLYGRSLGLWFPDGEEITLLLGLTGMATLLAATTHAPIMSTLMICEMTGEYQLLPGLLIACVIASVISRTLHRDSIYRQHTAQHS